MENMKCFVPVFIRVLFLKQSFHGYITALLRKQSATAFTKPGNQWIIKNGTVIHISRYRASLNVFHTLAQNLTVMKSNISQYSMQTAQNIDHRVTHLFYNKIEASSIHKITESEL